MAVKVCVFDAYGTLFDVSAAARLAAAEPGAAMMAAVWPRLSEVWRTKQLQYTWLRAITGAHVDFWTVTCEALDYALEAVGLDGEPALRERLRALYHELAAYPEVPAMLAALKGAGLKTAILSNGAPGMLAAAARSAGIEGSLDAILSVESVGVFKPDARVYAMVGADFGVTPDEVLFVSSNGWDAAAATGFGFTTLWVNRAGDPVDRLPWRPAHTARDLTAVPALAASL